MGLFRKKRQDAGFINIEELCTVTVECHNDNLVIVNFSDHEQVLRLALAGTESEPFLPPPGMISNHLSIALMFFCRVVNNLEGGGLDWQTLVESVYSDAKRGLESDLDNIETVPDFLPKPWQWGLTSEGEVLGRAEATLRRVGASGVAIYANFSFGGEETYPALEALGLLHETAVMTHGEPSRAMGIPPDYSLLLAALMALSNFYVDNPGAAGDVTVVSQAVAGSLQAALSHLTT